MLYIYIYRSELLWVNFSISFQQQKKSSICTNKCTHEIGNLHLEMFMTKTGYFFRASQHESVLTQLSASDEP